MNANKAKWVRLGDYIEQCDDGTPNVYIQLRMLWV